MSSKCFLAESFNLYLSHFLYEIPVFPISHLNARFTNSNIWSQSFRFALATVLGGALSLDGKDPTGNVPTLVATTLNNDMSAIAVSRADQIHQVIC